MPMKFIPTRWWKTWKKKWRDHIVIIYNLKMMKINRRAQKREEQPSFCSLMIGPGLRVYTNKTNVSHGNSPKPWLFSVYKIGDEQLHSHFSEIMNRSVPWNVISYHKGFDHCSLQQIWLDVKCCVQALEIWSKWSRCFLFSCRRSWD